MKELEFKLNPKGNGDGEGFKERSSIIRFVLSKLISHKNLITYFKKKKP